MPLPAPVINATLSFSLTSQVPFDRLVSILRLILQPSPAGSDSFAAEPVQGGGQRTGESQVGVAVRARDAAPNPEALPLTHDAETGGAVIVAPGQARRRPRGGYVALVGIDGRRVEHHHVRHVGNP